MWSWWAEICLTNTSVVYTGGVGGGSLYEEKWDEGWNPRCCDIGGFVGRSDLTPTEQPVESTEVLSASRSSRRVAQTGTTSVLVIQTIFKLFLHLSQNQTVRPRFLIFWDFVHCAHVKQQHDVWPVVSQATVQTVPLQPAPKASIRHSF